MGIVDGLDLTNLADAGWGIVFAADTPPAVVDALQPLISLRRQQAAAREEGRFKIFRGHEGGVRADDTKSSWLARQGAPNYGPVDPGQVPYYLLLVGGPEEIDFRFQYLLDVQYAVGRISFDSLAGYASYARAVVKSEREVRRLPARAVCFAPQHPADLHTSVLIQKLVLPLTEHLRAETGANWQVEALPGPDATKASLANCLAGPDGPALLVTAGHGVGLNTPGSQQQALNGALLCQDWPGPRRWQGPLPEGFYFSAEDVGLDQAVGGMISMHLSTYSAGTPRDDLVAKQVVPRAGGQAQRAFLSRLAQRFLSHPRGASLAFIGLAGRYWDFASDREGDRSFTAYAGVLAEIMRGKPVGLAMEMINDRYAELASSLSDQVSEATYFSCGGYDKAGLAALWTSTTTARDLVLLGDPAVRIRFS